MDWNRLTRLIFSIIVVLFQWLISILIVLFSIIVTLTLPFIHIARHAEIPQRTSSGESWVPSVAYVKVSAQETESTCPGFLRGTNMITKNSVYPAQRTPDQRGPWQSHRKKRICNPKGIPDRFLNQRRSNSHKAKGNHLVQALCTGLQFLSHNSDQ